MDYTQASLTLRVWRRLQAPNGSPVLSMVLVVLLSRSVFFSVKIECTVIAEIFVIYKTGLGYSLWQKLRKGSKRAACD